MPEVVSDTARALSWGGTHCRRQTANRLLPGQGRRTFSTLNKDWVGQRSMFCLLRTPAVNQKLPSHSPSFLCLFCLRDSVS
jgi:hypothetical protein